jgi:hypothetical protein
MVAPASAASQWPQEIMAWVPMMVGLVRSLACARVRVATKEMITDKPAFNILAFR